MKSIIVLAAALAVAPLASAGLYKYVDKDGKTVYSDQPPPDAAATQLHVAPQASGPAPKSYVEQDKDLNKARAEERDREKKKEIAEQNAKLEQERCDQARQNYHTFTDGGRLFKYNEKGEREFLSDEQIEAQRAKSKQEMDEACKSS